MTAVGVHAIGLRNVRFHPVRERSHEIRFWGIQAAVFVVTSVHGLIELTNLDDSRVLEGLSHLPVLVYLIPVTYAGLRYGVEGGLLTGLEVFALSTPNVLLFHRGDFEWTTELGSLAVVISVGVVLTIPVEWERRQRERAESRGQRLAFLNALAGRLAQTLDPEDSLDDIVERLADVALLECACIRLAASTDMPERFIAQPSCGIDEDCLSGGDRPTARSFALRAGAETLGELVVVPRAGAPFGAEEEELLEAVAHHLAIELETARLRREERAGLRAYVRAVTHAQEEERKRIARELHDEAAQPLVQLIRGLGRFGEADAVPDHHQAASEELRQLAVSILDNVRGYSRHLRPTTLDDLGLVPAVERIAGEAGARDGFAIEVRVTGTVRRLSPDVEIAAYRIVQEAIRNVERHASAEHVVVALDFAGRGCRITIEDDGVGFSVDEGFGRLAIGGRLGLVGMQERAELVGGSLSVRTSPSAGTTVTVELPG